MLIWLSFLLSKLIGVGLIGVVLYLAWRFVRAQEARARIGAPDEGPQRRIAQLEEAVARIDSELLRLEEGQRFVTRLLSERRESTAAPGKEFQ